MALALDGMIPVVTNLLFCLNPSSPSALRTKLLTTCSAFRIMRGDSLGHVRACYYGQPYPNGMNPPNAILMRIARAGQPQALIFCEWFMERAMSAQFPNGRNFNSNFFARAEAYKARYGLPPATAQIDIFYLFDSTFMHEVSVPTVTYVKTQAE